MDSSAAGLDPLDQLRKLWGQMGFAIPGMVTPTLDIKELDRRIQEFKAVEGWLRMNLNMLQMNIQGLEMQRAALAAMQAMGASGQPAEPGAPPSNNPFANPALWPWNLMSGGAPAAEDAPPDPPPGRKKA